MEKVVAMRSWSKMVMRGVFALVVLVAGLVAVAYAVTWRAMTRTIVLPSVEIAVVDDDATRARGEYLARTRGCGDCHGADYTGHLAIDAGPVGAFYGPNLTRGGRLAAYDIARFEHAVRHAVSDTGRPLLLMPSLDFAAMADSDVAAMYVYLRSLPASDAVQPPNRVGVLGRVLYLFGQLPLLAANEVDHVAASAPKAVPVASDTRGDAIALGRYVAQGCVGCHGERLTGGHVPGTPPSFKDAANLTPHATGLAGWTEAEFIRAMREGVSRDGRQLDPFMPWKTLGTMDDAELKALFAYLTTLEPREFGRR